ncbi:unnamed protein product [Cuscuta campestris]|uniref:Endonuclease/exonuclease/phosphatase domain-containing protein n=1 Tax=Cuscuta campestris TaxID=132261 RepID=A0A484N1P5_9ASTE|nr:unnamed protein product [Cuscuta campestris]
MSTLPWLCFGDFNAILDQGEKKGGLPKPSYLIQGFREALEDAGLLDFPLGGYGFTYDNGRKGDACVEKKLDRFLTSSLWRQKFPLATSTTFDFSSSDHLPIFMRIKAWIPRAQAANSDLRTPGLVTQDADPWFWTAGRSVELRSWNIN